MSRMKDGFLLLATLATGCFVYLTPAQASMDYLGRTTTLTTSGLP